jgi:hypothetical protein
MPVNKKQTATAIDNFLRFIITLLETSMPARRVGRKEPSLKGGHTEVWPPIQKFCVYRSTLTPK